MTKTNRIPLFERYKLPDFLIKENVSKEQYKKWLDRTARNHAKRDRKRWNKNTTISGYKKAIHQAVIKSKGFDAYTKEKLNWHLLGQFDNKKVKKGDHRFLLWPTVDHIEGGARPTSFRICSWRTNDAKSDLSYKDFLDLCKKVVKAASCCQ